MVKIQSLLKKKIYFLILFLFANVSATAGGWELIATGSNFKEFFKDAVRTGRTASILAMRDYSTEMTQGKISYLSVKKLYQFDCSRAKFRLALVEKYEKNKLEGELSYASKTKTGWKKVSPNTLNEAAMKKACKRQ